MGVRRPGQLGGRVPHAGLLYSCRWQPAYQRLAHLRDTAVCNAIALAHGSTKRYSYADRDAQRDAQCHAKCYTDRDSDCDDYADAYTASPNAQAAAYPVSSPNSVTVVGMR